MSNVETESPAATCSCGDDFALFTTDKSVSIDSTTNHNSLFRSYDWLSANQGPVFPDLVGSCDMYCSYSPSKTCPGKVESKTTE